MNILGFFFQSVRITSKKTSPQFFSFFTFDQLESSKSAADVTSLCGQPVPKSKTCVPTFFGGSIFQSISNVEPNLLIYFCEFCISIWIYDNLKYFIQLSSIYTSKIQQKNNNIMPKLFDNALNFVVPGIYPGLWPRGVCWPLNEKSEIMTEHQLAPNLVKSDRENNK